MSPKDDFASMMEGAAKAPALRKIRRGETVEGTIIALGRDSVFVDVGSGEDARIDRAECVDENGALRVRVGDRIRGVVVETGGSEGPRLSTVLGRGQVDLGAVQSALASGVPVEGTVKAANKGGLEVIIGGVRAFCPASQVEVGRAAELDSYVNRVLSFKVIEVRGDGTVVVSRRQLIEAERLAEGQRRLESLKVGDEVEGVVTSVQRYGAFVDLGGVEGLIHISELATRRVERVEDVVKPGDRVKVRVMGIEPSGKSTRVSLSMKALVATETPERNEVLEARVTEHAPYGLFVQTAKGTGLVRLRDLDLSPGSDHRRAYPVGKTVRVVLEELDERSGRLTFSMKRVEATEERKNYAEYAARSAAAEGEAKVGTFGALLAQKLGVQPAGAAKAPEPAPSRGNPPPAGPRRDPPAGVARRRK